MASCNVTLRTEIRRLIRTRRRRLTAAQRRTADDKINRHLTASPVFQYARRLAGFIANDGEPNLNTAMHTAWMQRKHWHLPKIGLTHSNRLWFAPYAPCDPLALNRFGIPEPDHPAKAATQPWAIQLLLMPLVAFDGTGNRLGMGKGYYDRTLNFLHHRRCWRKPVLMGIAYECQRVDAIPVQPWDIPLDGVVTEAGLRWFATP